jgi:hypothetical protein
VRFRSYLSLVDQKALENIAASGFNFVGQFEKEEKRKFEYKPWYTAFLSHSIASQAFPQSFLGYAVEPTSIAVNF